MRRLASPGQAAALGQLLNNTSYRPPRTPLTGAPQPMNAERPLVVPNGYCTLRPTSTYYGV
jgi:hypothetical protein